MTRSSLSYFNFLFFALNCEGQYRNPVIKIYLCANNTSREESPEKLPLIASTRECTRTNMFSHDVKRLRFRCQTLKFSHPINVKFPRQSFAVITVKNVRQICENPFTDISRAGKASGTTSSEK